MSEKDSRVGFSHLAEEVHNPTPQTRNPCNQFLRTNGDEYILVMVGLPGRGKTFIARSLCQYLTFFQRARCKVFNIGNYRRESIGAQCLNNFFDPDNQEGVKIAKESFESALSDLKTWFISEPVEGKNAAKVCVLDGFNGTKLRRKGIFDSLRPLLGSGSHVIFIESIIDETVDEENAQALQSNIEMAMEHMPDYKTLTREEALVDFKKRMDQKDKVYETIDGSERHYSWIKLVDAGRQFTMNRIHGFIPGKILQFLTNLSLSKRPIYLSRHGESMYNTLGKIGGDSPLSPQGEQYATELAKYVHTELLGLKENGEFQDPNKRLAPHVRLFTSSLRRTKDTARHIVHWVCEDKWVIMRPNEMRELDEIYAGVFDGMTYEEIKAKAPGEYTSRKADKLSYRYPRGESYLDVVKRLDGVVHEIGRLKDPILIVAHQGILRIIYSYLMGITLEEAPMISIPLNTIIKLSKRAYVCKEERVLLGALNGNQEPPSH